MFILIEYFNFINEFDFLILFRFKVFIVFRINEGKYILLLSLFLLVLIDLCKC